MRSDLLIFFSMARLARIQPGQTVIDPMMGVGTIPIGILSTLFLLIRFF